MSDRNRLQRHLRPASAAIDPDPSSPEPSPDTCLVIQDEPFSLSLELKGGNIVALPYSSYLSIDFDPSVSIVIEFHTHTVTITGVNLKPICEAVANRTAATLRCIGDRPTPKKDGVPVIHVMKISKRERS